MPVNNRIGIREILLIQLLRVQAGSRLDFSVNGVCQIIILILSFALRDRVVDLGARDLNPGINLRINLP